MKNKISNEQILKNMSSFLNKDVIIMPGHPHENERGKTIRAEIPAGMNKPAMLVRLESGTECYVFKPNELFFITHVIPVDKVKN